MFQLQFYHYYRRHLRNFPISDATVFPLYGHIIDLLSDSSLNICVFFLGKLCAAHCSPFLWPHYWCEKTVEFQARRSHFLHFPHVAKVALPVCGAVLMQRREHTHRCDQRQYGVMDVTMSDSRINYQIVKRWGSWCLKTVSWWLYSELYDKIFNRIPILHCFLSYCQPPSHSLVLPLSSRLSLSRSLAPDSLWQHGRQHKVTHRLTFFES